MPKMDKGQGLLPRLFEELGTGMVVFILVVIPACLVPGAWAGSNSKQTSRESAHLDGAFPGHLPITELSEDEAILHALNRLGYGPRPGDLERVRQMGLEKWIEQQLNPGSLPDSDLDARLGAFRSLTMSPAALEAEYPSPDKAARQLKIPLADYRAQFEDAVKQRGVKNVSLPGFGERGPQQILQELMMAKLERAVYSDRQLLEQMDDFWFNHFNVFYHKGADRWLVGAYEREIIRPHAFGKFRDFLIATAQSPAMLFYLDNWLSADPHTAEREDQLQVPSRAKPARPAPRVANRRGLNENYGRELLELHTVGVDAGYTQKDVTEAARCLTGWTLRGLRDNPEFYFEVRLHDPAPKRIMGKRFQHGGIRDGEELLKMLAKNPSTARFISTKLARRFVSDQPPERLVAAMTKTFQKRDGDIRAVLRTMIYSPEFWSRAVFRAKVKTPFELVVSTARALDLEVENPLPLVQWVARMGEPLYQCQPPTGYSDRAEAWVNSGALLSRLNFALALSSGHVSGARSGLIDLFGEGASTDPQQALGRALELFLGGQVSPETRATLEQRLSKAWHPEPVRYVQGKLGEGSLQLNSRTNTGILRFAQDDSREQRAAVSPVNEGLVAGLVLGSPEFQRR